MIARPCATEHCSRQTPPTPLGQAKPYRYCAICRAERIKDTARRSKRSQRGLVGSGAARPLRMAGAAKRESITRNTSWWLDVAPDGFTVKAESQLERMSPSRGAEIARQMEVLRLW